MGVVETISATTFPRQGPDLGGRVVVCFNYGPPDLLGTVVRDDRDPPFRTIIRLDDGRHVLTTECQRSTPRTTLPRDPLCAEIVELRATAERTRKALEDQHGATDQIWNQYHELKRIAERLEGENKTLREKYPAHRWNVEPTDDGVRVCRGEHQSAEACEWEYHVQESVSSRLRATAERYQQALEREASSLEDYANEVESPLTERVLRGTAARLRAASSIPAPLPAPEAT